MNDNSICRWFSSWHRFNIFKVFIIYLPGPHYKIQLRMTEELDIAPAPLCCAQICSYHRKGSLRCLYTWLFYTSEPHQLDQVSEITIANNNALYYI